MQQECCLSAKVVRDTAACNKDRVGVEPPDSAFAARLPASRGGAGSSSLLLGPDVSSVLPCYT